MSARKFTTQNTPRWSELSPFSKRSSAIEWSRDVPVAARIHATGTPSLGTFASVFALTHMGLYPSDARLQPEAVIWHPAGLPASPDYCPLPYEDRFLPHGSRKSQAPSILFNTAIHPVWPRTTGFALLEPVSLLWASVCSRGSSSLSLP